jgi:hypothetical protein
MAINKCKSRIYFKNEADMQLEPFRTERNEKAFEMFCEGKAALWPNMQIPVPPYNPLIGKRYWIDRVAAQEFIDWVVERAKTYNIEIDLDATYVSDQPKEFWIDYSQQVDNKP